MKLYAVIVSFNPKYDSLYHLLRVLDEAGVDVFLIDNNSSNKENFANFNLQRVEIILLKNNVGIAAAQNIGINLCINNENDLIIFFDQDSRIDRSYIDTLLMEYMSLKEKNIDVGVLGPRFVDERYGFYYKTVNLNKYGFRKKIDVSNIKEPIHSSLLISSGSLVSIETLKEVGLMRENYFIDYVDTEWCIRAESLGYKNYISSNAKMIHAIGDNVLQFKYFNVPVHSSFRRYYRVRNAYYMLREPHVPKFLAFREIIFNFIHQLILVIFEKDKKGYIKSYLRGCIDGIFKYEKN